MLRRLYFPLTALFWVAMNVLLWRSEMGAPGQGGTPVPVETVFARILTAPDDSSLVIFRDGQRIGSCHWLPTVEEADPAVVGGEDFAPEGRVGRITGYQIDFDGSLARRPGASLYTRFQWHLEFAPDRTWRRLSLRLVQRPQQWEISADAARKELSLRGGAGAGAWEQTFTFAELSDPKKLLRRLGGPFAGLATQGLFAQLPAGTPRQLALGLRWEATQDWLRVAHARTRVYRLRARLFEGHEITVLLSRVGEILRVDLPGNLRLLNEGFAGFP
jgi:hypothetical protein